MFQLLFERSADAIWLFDPAEGIFVDCNAAAVALMRASSKEKLLRTQPAEVSAPLQPDGRASALAAAEITALVAKNGAHRFEWLARRLDGTDVPLEIIATAIQARGQALHVVVSRDMSESKRVEAELRASEERWRLLFEQSPLSVHTFASDGTTRQVNRAWEKLFGLSKAAITPFNILQDRHLEEAGAMPAIRRAFSGEVVSVPPVRFELPAPAGQPGPIQKWIGAIMFPLRDAEGRVIEVVCVHEDITERKQAEDEIRWLNATLEKRVEDRTSALAASEASLRTLIDHAPEAIVVLDGVTGRFMECNDNAVRLFGLPPEQLRLLQFAEVSPLVQPDGRLSLESIREHLQTAIDGGAPVFDWIHKHSSGRLVPCEVRLVRLPAEGQTLVRGSVTDNSERKRREKIQRATYQISEAVHAAVDLENLYLRIHTIIKALMPAENFYIALFEPVTQLIHFPYFVDERSPHPEPFRLGTGLTGYVLRTGIPLLVDRAMNTRKRSVGDQVTFEGMEDLRYVESGPPAAIWLGVPLTVQGQPIGVMAVQDYLDPEAYGEDDKQILGFVAKQTALAIDRKRAEQALRESATRLRESEARFSAAFHANPVCTTLARMTDGHFVEANEAFLEWYGAPAPDVLGQTSIDLDLWASGEGRAGFWQELSGQGRIRHRECELRNRRGAVHTMLLSADIIEINHQPHVLTVGLDITDRKKAEVELLKALGREKELSQLKSDFVSTVSHEFRTPLGVIMSSAEILQDYLAQLPEEERRDHLRSIARHAKRMAELMEGVLVLGRLDAGRMDFKPALLDLRAFWTRLVEEVITSTEHRCPIRCEFGGLPNEGRADERLLRHIFINLLANAIKYSDLGCPVEFRIERDHQDAVCRIQDRGIGIPEADRPRLFQSFHRGRNVGQRAGTGLGLVIVKRCVELHGGRLAFESQAGKGTTVTVWLPLFECES